MEARHGCPMVSAAGRDLEAANGRILVRLVFRDGGYVQEFHAAGSDGTYHLVLSSLHRNLLLASHHRVCASPMISGGRQHLYGACRESMRIAYTEAVIASQDNDHVTLRLSGTLNGHSLKCDITLCRSSEWVRVVVEDEIIPDSPGALVEYVMSSYAFLPGGEMVAKASALDYVWTPNLRPASDHVIGDCSFASPALIVQRKQFAAALVPDVQALAANRALPAALDLDIDNGLLATPLLSYGFCDYETTPHGFARHDATMSRRMGGRHLTHTFHLLVDAACRRRTAHRRVADFVWETCGGRHHRCFGTRVSESIEAPPVDAWAAFGLQASDPEPLGTHGRQARRTKELILRSPQNQGLFTTRFDETHWNGCEMALPDACYSTFECSQQLYWLLKWNEHVEQDSRIIPFCQHYADFLIRSRLRSGAIPSWYTRSVVPISPLRSSAQTAASVVFLAELARATGLSKYAAASEQSGKFLLREVVERWEFPDHLRYDRTNCRSIDLPDPHTGSAYQGAWAMLWTAQALAALYKLTLDRAWLKPALSVLDQLCLLQAVRDLPDGLAPSGACRAGNVGGPIDAELTAEFGRCAMECGDITGRRAYFDRGTAALQAAAQIASDSTSSARVTGSVALVGAAYGGAFVHVGRKWASNTIQPLLRDVQFRRGAIVISTELGQRSNLDSLVPTERRIVFGGLRGRSYRLAIDGRALCCTREELERGLPAASLVRKPPSARPKSPRSSQPALFGRV